MLKLVQVLVLAVLCSSTQGMYIDIYTLRLNLVILLFLYLLGRLVQVSDEETCSNDIVIFWCSNEMGFLNWIIMDRTGVSLRTFSLPSNTVKHNLTQGSSLVAQVTFINGPFINGTVIIMGPSNLNGGTIRCNQDILTLNIPANTGKFLVTGIAN